MKIYLVRHGETDANKNNIMQGRVENLQLNRKGIIEATNLKEKLKDINFKVCYTSPLIRTWSTAMILVGDRVEIKEDERLIERYLGELEGKERSLYDQKKYWDYKLNSNDLEVESIKNLLARTEDFLKEIKEKYQDNDNVLVVAHSAIIRAIMNIIENKNYPDKLITYKVDNCVYKVYEI